MISDLVSDIRKLVKSVTFYPMFDNVDDLRSWDTSSKSSGYNIFLDIIIIELDS